MMLLNHSFYGVVNISHFLLIFVIALSQPEPSDGLKVIPYYLPGMSHELVSPHHFGTRDTMSYNECLTTAGCFARLDYTARTVC